MSKAAMDVLIRNFREWNAARGAFQLCSRDDYVAFFTQSNVLSDMGLAREPQRMGISWLELSGARTLSSEMLKDLQLYRKCVPMCLQKALDEGKRTLPVRLPASKGGETHVPLDPVTNFLAAYIALKQNGYLPKSMYAQPWNTNSFLQHNGDMLQALFGDRGRLPMKWVFTGAADDVDDPEARATLTAKMAALPRGTKELCAHSAQQAAAAKQQGRHACCMHV